MANFFEQYAPKGPQVGGEGGNFFAQFADQKPPSSVPLSPATSGGDGAFFGLAKALPESVSQFLPGFMKGPSVGQQMAGEQSRLEAETKQLGRPLTLSERLKLQPATESPVATGFGTHQLTEGLAAGIATKNAATAENFINQAYSRAVGPTVRGKSTDPAWKAYLDKARDAFSSIVDNKPNLQFSDAAGHVVSSGKLPETMEQFGDAIGQTKKEIFNKYDSMIQQTGGRVFLQGVRGALGQQINNIANLVAAPNVVKYARKRLADFSNVVDLSPSDAQSAIQKLNETLKSYYADPRPKTAARASVDAVIANMLRQELDFVVTSYRGPGYQELKNQYGALSEIEKHVVHRAQFLAKQQPGGGLMGRLADVLSIGEAYKILAGDVTGPVRAAAIKATAQVVKHLRSPNRAVKKLFEAAEKQHAQPPPAPRHIRALQSVLPGPSAAPFPPVPPPMTPGLVPSVPLSPFTLPADQEAMRRAAGMTR